MANKIDNAITMLDKVTNTDVETFAFTITEDKKQLVMSVVDAVSTMDTCFPYFFKPNVFSGKITVKRIDFTNMKAVKAFDFANDTIRYFYHVVLSDVEDIKKRLADVEEKALSDKHAIAYKVLMARIDNAIAICKAAKHGIESCIAAKQVALSIYGAKASNFDDKVKQALKPIMTELKALYDENGEQLPNVKALRDKITKLNNAIFQRDENGIVGRNNRKCTDKVARDVYSRYYNGRHYGSDGKVIAAFAKDEQILTEIIAACIEAMQYHSIEIVPTDNSAK